MEIIEIAGVKIRKKSKDSFTYEQLMSLAITTPKYYKLNDRIKLIDKELRQNGFKPTKASRAKTKQNNVSNDRKVIRKRATRKPKRDS